MDLIVLIILASLGCTFMLFVLFFWVQDVKSKSRTNSQRSRTEPFLVKRKNGNPTSDVAMIRRKGTGELRLSEKAAARSKASDSEMLVRRRIVQVFATRVAPRRDE